MCIRDRRTISVSLASTNRSCVSAPAWPPVVAPQVSGSLAVGAGVQAAIRAVMISNALIGSLYVTGALVPPYRSPFLFAILGVAVDMSAMRAVSYTHLTLPTSDLV